MRCLFLLCGWTLSICVPVYALTLWSRACIACMCVGWGGLQDVTAGWWGTAPLLTRVASGCESVPKPVAVVLVQRHRCQDRKLTVAFGVKTSLGVHKMPPEIRVRGAGNPTGDRRGNEETAESTGYKQR